MQGQSWVWLQQMALRWTGRRERAGYQFGDTDMQHCGRLRHRAGTSSILAGLASHISGRRGRRSCDFRALGPGSGFSCQIPSSNSITQGPQ